METEKSAAKILEIMGLTDALIDICLLDGKKMQELNLRTRQKDEITDVLSFPNLELSPDKLPDIRDYPLEVEDGKLFLGSIALCMPRIESQAAELGHSTECEKTYLLIHGILHLLGYDHESADDKNIMREKEKSILKKYNYDNIN